MSGLMKLKIRKLVEAGTDKLIETLSGRFIIVFEDGVELESTDIMAIYSSFTWEFYKRYPKAKVTSKMFIGSIGDVRAINGSHRVEMFRKAVWDIHDQYKAQGFDDEVGRDYFETVSKLIFEQNNWLHNYGAVALPEYVQTTDILDYREVYNYPPIREIIASIQPDQDVFMELSKRLTEIVLKDDNIAHNQLIRAARTGLVRMHQFIQVLLVRGFVQDLDSRIFADPSMGNYLSGYADMYSQVIDTRTAGVSLRSSAHLLRRTQYSSRKLEILDMTIECVDPGDCGSTEFLEWRLGGILEDGKPVGVHANDIENWVGKYFLNEETNKLEVLERETAGKYLGQTLLFRDALAGCNHPDPNTICSTCFGYDEVTVPDKTNIGHLMATAMMKILAQLILSTKHFAGSSSATHIAIVGALSNYFRTTPDGGGYMLQPREKDVPIYLCVNQAAIGDISILSKIKNITKMPVEQISNIENVTFMTVDAQTGVMNTETHNVAFEKRRANFSYNALEHIKRNGWTRDEKNDYIFDFTTFDVNQPIMSLPKRFFNTSDHAESITRLIQGSTDDKKKKYNENRHSLTHYFYDLYCLVNERLQIRASVLSIIMFGAAIRSYEDGDFRLPKGGVKGQLGSTLSTMPGRGIGGIIPFEHHRRAFFSVQNYSSKNLQDHCFDALVMPTETLLHRADRGLA